jgi:enolase
MKIARVEALQIFDSRGDPTVEAVVWLENGMCGRGLVPSGASVGRHEALELRDGDPARFRGRSVFRAISNIETEIAPVLAGLDAFDQAGIDARLIALDGTANKSRLGANAVLAVSMAAANAGSAARGMPLHAYLGDGRGNLLPLPEIQIIGGGRHAQKRIDIQDIMLVPLTARSYAESLEMAFGVYHAAGDVMRERGLLSGVADEGGYWPHFERNEDALEVSVAAIRRAGYDPGREVGLSLDIAASDLFRNGAYELELENRRFSSVEFGDVMVDWLDRYPVVSLEDPMAEDDWEGWSRLCRRIGGRCQLIGDDHFATSLVRIERGIADRTANAVLIKLNQIGTVTETLSAIRRTQEAGWLPIVSARSGETEDAFIAHLAVGSNAGQLKVGSFSRGERMAKWNEVLRIAKALGQGAQYIGADIFGRAGIRLGQS